MELVRALGELAEAPGQEQLRNARLLELPGEPTRADYTDLFVVQLYPYASVYLSRDGQLGGQVQEHIAGFWRVLRQPVPRDPDHIATLFATYAQLIRPRETAETYVKNLTGQMRHAFLWEHMASWLLPFVSRVREVGSTFYRAWATLVVDALEVEAAQVGPPSVLPLHLRNALAMPASPRLDDLIELLFAPVRCGMIITRSDLARCARDLDMQIRIAERRYTLRTMLQQDGRRVSEWLANEAHRQAASLPATPNAFGDIAKHWSGRAQQTAALLSSYESDRNEVPGVSSGLTTHDG